MEGHGVMRPIGTVNRSDVKYQLGTGPQTVPLVGSNFVMETIGHRVRTLREAASLTREDLGKAVGASKSTIQNLEEAPKLQSSRYLRPIAEFFRVNQRWLETGKGEKFVAPVAYSELSEARVHDVRQSYSERPDAAKMAAAYGAVVANGFLMGTTISAARADHMEVVCDAYLLISQGKEILPGQTDAEEVVNAIKQRLGVTGDGGREQLQGKQHGAGGKHRDR